MRRGLLWPRRGALPPVPCRDVQERDRVVSLHQLPAVGSVPRRPRIDSLQGLPPHGALPRRPVLEDLPYLHGRRLHAVHQPHPCRRALHGSRPAARRQLLRLVVRCGALSCGRRVRRLPRQHLPDGRRGVRHLPVPGHDGDDCKRLLHPVRGGLLPGNLRARRPRRVRTLLQPPHDHRAGAADRVWQRRVQVRQGVRGLLVGLPGVRDGDVQGHCVGEQRRADVLPVGISRRRRLPVVPKRHVRRAGRAGGRVGVRRVPPELVFGGWL
mmetsp:Transcript_21741/g.50460  ORF Transcript_21741/g.50460 Transcript_21741/m.50460 type:complete len:268 (-) Transcript_21741:693-1496(-)